MLNSWMTCTSQSLPQWAIPPTDSVLLQGLVDHTYRFLDFDVDWPRKCHNAYVFDCSRLCRKLEDGMFSLQSAGRSKGSTYLPWLWPILPTVWPATNWSHSERVQWGDQGQHTTPAWAVHESTFSTHLVALGSLVMHYKKKWLSNQKCEVCCVCLCSVAQILWNA